MSVVGPDETESSAVKLAYWQGRVDERMKAGDSRFDRLDASIKEIKDGQSEMSTELTKIKTKVAIYGAISAAVVSFIATLISNKGI